VLISLVVEGVVLAFKVEGEAALQEVDSMVIRMGLGVLLEEVGLEVLAGVSVEILNAMDLPMDTMIAILNVLDGSRPANSKLRDQSPSDFCLYLTTSVSENKFS
jgi:hypothetical protein